MVNAMPDLRQRRLPRAALLLAALALAFAAARASAQGTVADTIQRLVGQCVRGDKAKCDDGIAVLDRELDLNPEYPWGQMMYGFCLEVKGDAAGAIGRFKVAREQDPNLFEAYYNQARLHSKRGEYGQVIQVLESAPFDKAARPAYAAKGRKLLGKAYLQERRHGDAVRVLEGAADDYDSYRSLGLAHYGLRSWAEAAAAFENAVEQPEGGTAADRAEVVRLASEAHLNAAQGRGVTDAAKRAAYRKALEAAREAVKKAAGDAKAWESLGNAALGAKEFEEAERAFRKLLEMKPGDCEAQMNLGQTLLGAKRYKDAEKQLERATACLRGDKKKYALNQLGFTRLGIAKDVCPKCENTLAECDVDDGLRRRAIAAYEQAGRPFSQAGNEGQVKRIDQTIATLEIQIEGIQRNIRVRKDNEEIRQERLRIWGLEIETDRAADSDRDGVPDPADRCPGQPAPGDPNVGLDGCPYKPPCT